MTLRIVRREFDQTALCSLSSYHPILARLYASRGVHVAHDLARDSQNLLPYQSLLGIDKAVTRLATALYQQQRIVIVGDFDADGATSTVLAMRALRQFGAESVDYLVPNRFQFGYGLTPEIVNVAMAKAPDLIITVDNGIASCSGVGAANKAGIDVIVTDHHLPGRELPSAVAIVNPNQTGCAFASKNLAGVGVIFYLMLALRAHLRASGWFVERGGLPNMAELLDLVALGTVADVVPLDRNNRILVHQGLQRIRAGRCCIGMHALLDVAKRNAAQVGAPDLAFAIGPRLNAAGRLDDMSLGIACLLSDDREQANTIAQRLDELNRSRRAIEQDMQAQALTALERLQLGRANTLPCGVVLFDKNWHQGVVGILASRIKERVHRPVICFTQVGDDEIKGSARSIAGFHIRDALDQIATQNPGLIEKFGGHAMAAGLSLRKDQLPIFTQVFAQVAAQQLTDADLTQTIASDGELAQDDLTIDLAQLLSNSGPWGQGFPEPLFDGTFRVLTQRILGQKHVKWTLTLPHHDHVLDAIAFNVDHAALATVSDTIQAVYRLSVNEYRGQCKLQLLIEQFDTVDIQETALID